MEETKRTYEDEDFFNKETKIEYLKSLSPSLEHVCATIFANTVNIETAFKKDLYDFSLDELQQIIQHLNPATIISARNFRSRILMYIDWAIEHGRRVNNINPLQGITPEWDKRFADVVGDRYFSIETIDEIVDSLDNAQDKALVYCLFEGVGGQGINEILQLKITDLDTNIHPYKLKIRDKNAEVYREIEISDKCATFIQQAYAQHTYVSISGGNLQDLVPYDDRVFKKAAWKNKNSATDECKRHNLVVRLAHIQKEYSLGEFSANTIEISGRIRMAAEYIKENGKMDKEGYNKIGDHYNLTKVKWGDYLYYNHGLMRAYINDKYLENLYGVSLNG